MAPGGLGSRIARGDEYESRGSRLARVARFKTSNSASSILRRTERSALRSRNTQVLQESPQTALRRMGFAGARRLEWRRRQMATTQPESAACGWPPRRAYRPLRSCGRVAEGGGLLNRYRVVKPYRGFESPPAPPPAFAYASARHAALNVSEGGRHPKAAKQRRRGWFKLPRSIRRLLSSPETSVTGRT